MSALNTGILPSIIKIWPIIHIILKSVQVHIWEVALGFRLYINWWP